MHSKTATLSIEREISRQYSLRRQKELLTIAMLLTPAFIFIGIFTNWALFETFSISFLNWNMVSPVKQWVGAGNYIDIFQMKNFWVSLWHTAEYIVLLVLLNVIAPYLCAFMVLHIIKRGQNFYKSAFFFPSMISLSVAAMIFMWIFNPLAGPIGEIMRASGMQTIDWLRNPQWVVLAISIITAWKCFGYNFIVIMAGLMSIPKEVIEAARIDGMNNRQILLKLFLPLSSPTVLYVLVLTVVNGLQNVFVPVHMLTNGGPDQGSTNLVFFIYQIAFQFFQSGKAGACAVMTTIVFTALVLLQSYVAEKAVHYEN